MTSLDAAGISRLLHALDSELAARGTTADVYLVGGAAIALSFDSARTTRDLDAVFVPATQVRAAAQAVADANGLTADWLNDAVKGFVPPGTDTNQTVVFESPHLRVCVASAEHLLAMKVAAARVEQDRGDLALLVGVLGLSSADEAIAVARACLGPGYPIPPRAQYLLEEIFEQPAMPTDPPARVRPHVEHGQGIPDTAEPPRLDNGLDLA
ncbi:MAG: DUF6036 family nucleotidyltransferase [Candidatus Nanopelagicales bacterium]